MPWRWSKLAVLRFLSNPINCVVNQLVSFLKKFPKRTKSVLNCLTNWSRQKLLFNLKVTIIFSRVVHQKKCKVSFFLIISVMLRIFFGYNNRDITDFRAYDSLFAMWWMLSSAVCIHIFWKLLVYSFWKMFHNIAWN